MQTDAKTYTISAVATTTPIPIIAGDFLGLQVSGSPVGLTLALEVSIDGTNFTALSLLPVGGGAAVTSVTAAGAWQSATGTYAIRSARLNTSALTSGTASATLAIGTEGR